MKRITYALTTAVLLLIGLSSRRFTEGGDFIHDYVGDAIWAAMIYVGLRFFNPFAHIKTSVLAAITFCFLIELSQLVQTDWLNQIRANWLGGLILGFGFRWSDLVMYSIGIVLIAVLDNSLLSKNKVL